MKTKLSRDIRPDAQAFDEITIKTIPRYKTSGLSGDEWRISALVEFKRKGIVKATKTYSNVDIAARFLGKDIITVGEDGAQFFGGEGDFCDQEGCSKNGTVMLKKKKEYCRHGHESDHAFETYRLFCEDHKTRGDCGLDDADRNYEILESQPPRKA